MLSDYLSKLAYANYLTSAPIVNSARLAFRDTKYLPMNGIARLTVQPDDNLWLPCKGMPSRLVVNYLVDPEGLLARKWYVWIRLSSSHLEVTNLRLEVAKQHRDIPRGKHRYGSYALEMNQVIFAALAWLEKQEIVSINSEGVKIHGDTSLS